MKRIQEEVYASVKEDLKRWRQSEKKKIRRKIKSVLEYLKRHERKAISKPDESHSTHLILWRCITST